MGWSVPQSQHVRLGLDMYKATRHNDNDNDGGKLREHDAPESDAIRAFEDAFA